MGQSKGSVVLGLSGGVDSSVAAWLLKEQGWEVIGVALKLWSGGCRHRTADRCCGPDALHDAEIVCRQLGIPFYVYDLSDQFEKEVILYFVDEYLKGRTPNPCVVCNQRIKFRSLIQIAAELGAQNVATGHYVRLEWSSERQRWLIRRAVDARRDQSYFLFTLTQEVLGYCLFPLGEFTKSQVREIARQLGLVNAQKAESVEVCFVSGRDYREFLRTSGFVLPKPGPIVDTEGRQLGQHDGIPFYTIGQRRGLRISAGRPLYVIRIDPDKNSIVVGPAEMTLSRVCWVERPNWVAVSGLEAIRHVWVKIRYNHPGAWARIEASGSNDLVRVEFDEPQRAITPGQAAVFYDGDILLGGGWIRQVEHTA